MALFTMQELHDQVVPGKIEDALKKVANRPLTDETLREVAREAAEGTFNLTMMMIELVYRLEQFAGPRRPVHRTTRL